MALPTLPVPCVGRKGRGPLHLDLLQNQCPGPSCQDLGDRGRPIGCSCCGHGLRVTAVPKLPAIVMGGRAMTQLVTSSYLEPAKTMASIFHMLVGSKVLIP